MATREQVARPASGSLYHVAGRLLCVRTFDDYAAQLAEKFIAAWHFTPVGSDGISNIDCTIELRRESTPPAVPSEIERFEVPHGVCYTDGETSYLKIGESLIRFNPPNRKTIEVWIDDETSERTPVALARLFFYATQAALRRCGRYEIHAAGVVAPGSRAGALMIGVSGSGKTTLAVRLALAGWGYLSDDSILLGETPDGVAAWGFRKVFSLTGQTLDAVALPRVGDATRASVDFDPDKRRLEPSVMFPFSFAASTYPQTLFFASITNAPSSAALPLAPREAMTRLMKMCPWACYDAPVAREHLRALERLSKQAGAFELRAGQDVLREPETAAQLVAAHMGVAL